MRPRNAFILATAASLMAAATARAEVGAVVVFGKIPERERTVVASAVKQVLLDAKWSISETIFSSSELNNIKVCLDLDRPWACVEPTVSAKGVQRLVVAHVEHKGKAILVTGQLLVQSDAVPPIEPRHCEPCSEIELDQAAQEATRALLSRMGAPEHTTAIEIHVAPPDASIEIDGKPIVAGTVTLPISAGVHQVQIRRAGFRDETRSITVGQGQTYKLTVALTSDSDRPRSRLVPLLIMGAGGAALVGGALYSFTVDPPDTFEQPRYLYSGPAIGIAAAGGAALGLGLYLWLRSPTKPQRRPAPTATLTLQARGGLLGWTTSF